MISGEDKVNFSSQTTAHGIDTFVVERLPEDTSGKATYLLFQPENPDKGIVGLSVQNHTPGVYEIAIEDGERTPAALAMLANAAFRGLARESATNISVLLEANKNVPEITLDDIVALGKDFASEKNDPLPDERRENVFALVDMNQLPEAEALARKSLYEETLGMEAVKLTATGELIMLGGSAREVVGSAGWTLHDTNIQFTDRK